MPGIPSVKIGEVRLEGRMTSVSVWYDLFTSAAIHGHHPQFLNYLLIGVPTCSGKLAACKSMLQQKRSQRTTTSLISILIYY